MKATIELPEPVFQNLQDRAEQQGSTIQAVILEAIEKGIGFPQTPHQGRSRVSLPLIRSISRERYARGRTQKSTTSLAEIGYLADVNVWIAIASDRLLRGRLKLEVFEIR